MKRRRPDPRRAKIHRPYDVADIAKLFEVHRNTVRSWLKQGLRAIERVWPTLVLGAELRRFLTEKQGRRKRRLQDGQMYCMPCREPRSPALDMAEYVPLSPTGGNLKALCPECETWMYRRVRPSDLDRLKAILDVTVTPADEPLRQTSHPSVNHDSNTPG
ncbi:MAG: DNA-binding protein [Nitrospirae bacterium]|nr:MAG: DNA-binding protein [Nitrospirota bacterium]